VPTEEYPESELTGKIIGVAIDVHKEVGPGFVEKVYQRILARAFRKNGIPFEREVKVRIEYDGGDVGFQVVDFIVCDKVPVEIKAVGEICEAHVAQLISYLKITKRRVGLILNFGSGRLGIKRVIL